MTPTPPRIAGAAASFRGAFESPAGDQAQVDFARFVTEFTAGHDPLVWVFSLVLGHSRYMFARYIMHQDL